MRVALQELPAFFSLWIRVDFEQGMQARGDLTDERGEGVEADIAKGVKALNDVVDGREAKIGVNEVEQQIIRSWFDLLHVFEIEESAEVRLWAIVGSDRFLIDADDLNNNE